MNKNSKIYVAGHTGMVGSAIVRQLKEQGYTNIIGKTHTELDLTQQIETEKFFAQERPEYVFVAAAKVGGIKANSTYPVEFGTINMQIACNVLKSAFNNKVKKLLYLGSACIYPNDCEFPIKEDKLLNGYLEPTNEAYSIAKSFGIRLCEYYKKEYGANFVAVQPANCYGEGDSFDVNNSHVIPALIRKYHEAKLKGTEQIELWGTGSPKREFIYVDDLANACIFVMENYSGEKFINVGTSEEISILELTNIVSKTVGYNGKIVCDISKPDGKMRNLIDSSKLLGMGWKPKYSIKDGINKLYKWYLENTFDQEKGVFNKKSKIYVAGHNGMVGSAIVRKLNSMGFTNIIGKSSRELDLRDKNAVADFMASEKPDIVFLAAANVGGILDNKQFPAEHLIDNIRIESNVIESAYKNGCKNLLFISSNCIYPLNAELPLKEEYALYGKLDKDWEGYGLSKVVGVKLCEYFSTQYGVNYISVVPCNLYGINDCYDRNKSRVVASLIMRIHQAKVNKLPSVEIWGTGKPLREFLFADDLADACIFLMNNYQDNSIINIGPAKEHSIAEIAQTIKNVIGYEGKLEFNSEKPDGIYRKNMDTKKINSLGWHAKTSLLEGIKMSYKDYVDKLEKVYSNGGGGVKYSRKLLFSWHSALQFQRGAA